MCLTISLTSNISAFPKLISESGANEAVRVVRVFVLTVAWLLLTYAKTLIAVLWGNPDIAIDVLPAAPKVGSAWIVLGDMTPLSEPIIQSSVLVKVSPAADRLKLACPLPLVVAVKSLCTANDMSVNAFALCLGNAKSEVFIAGFFSTALLCSRTGLK